MFAIKRPYHKVLQIVPLQKLHVESILSCLRCALEVLLWISVPDLVLGYLRLLENTQENETYEILIVFNH